MHCRLLSGNTNKVQLYNSFFFPLSLGNGRSPHWYINHRLQIQLELLMMSGVPLETCWAFNKLGIINSITKLHLVGIYWVIYDARIHEYQNALFWHFLLVLCIQCPLFLSMESQMWTRRIKWINLLFCMYWRTVWNKLVTEVGACCLVHCTHTKTVRCIQESHLYAVLGYHGGGC
jgi:hypothetical protein